MEISIWNLYVILTVFNQKTLYNAYKKRTKNVEIDLEEYNKMKESDPEFYREASSLQYGKVSISEHYDIFWCISGSKNVHLFLTLWFFVCLGTKDIRGQNWPDGEGTQRQGWKTQVL